LKVHYDRPFEGIAESDREAAGLPEPYRRLTEKPDHVPQWYSKHWLKAGERKGGGKRRKAS
jgi:hypothetical protein